MSIEKYLASFSILCLTRLSFLEIGFVAGSAMDPINSGAFKPVCETIAFLKKSGPWIWTKMNESARLMRALHGDLGRLQLQNESRTGKESDENCPDTNAVLIHAATEIKGLQQTHSELLKTGVRLAVSAGVSAGRLEELIMVFSTSKTSAGYCISKLKTTAQAKIEDLGACFTNPRESKAPDEENLLDPNVLEPDEENGEGYELEGSVQGMAFKGDATNNYQGDSTAKCHLIKAAGGGLMESNNLKAEFLWGGGVIRLHGTFDGEPSNLAGGDSASGNAGKWTDRHGEKIVHLKRTLNSLKTFKQELGDLEGKARKLKGKMSKCIDEAIYPDNPSEQELWIHHLRKELKEKRRLSEELKNSTDLLGRYRNEKGDLKAVKQRSDGSAAEANSADQRGAFQAALFQLYCYLAVLI